jgi:Skp family chaperone for outer membrane proteins
MSDINKAEIAALHRRLIEKNEAFVALLKEDANNEKLQELTAEISSINDAIRTVREKGNFNHLL